MYSKFTIFLYFLQFFLICFLYFLLFFVQFFQKNFFAFFLHPGSDSDEIKDGFWMGLVYKGKWEWVDNWPLAVSNWAPGHPDQDTWSQHHDCARMNKYGHFYNDRCSKKLPYVCKDAVFLDGHIFCTG